MSIKAGASSEARAYRWLAATQALAARGAKASTAERRLRALAAAMQSDDVGARAHARRVGGLCRQIAEAMGLTVDEAEIVALAGQLHDVGAMDAVPAVGRAGPVYRRHPVIGAQLVAPFDVLGLAAPMIRHHHERLDGSGYPDGLRGDAVPLGARIIAVADEYDHLVWHHGSASLAHDGAVGVLAGRVGMLDAAVIAALIKLPLP